MSTPRFHLEAPLSPGAQLVLPPDAAHHASRVLRLRDGDAIVLFNGEGGEYAARIVRLSREGVTVDVGAFDPIDRESPLAITLVQGISAGDRMDLTIQKAVELYGLGNDAVRWIEVDSELRMRMDRLRERMAEDRRAGLLPFLVIGTGGSVATGAVDPLPDIATLCREERVWFHVDGAYGAPAARVPGAPATLAALGDADSVAVDPHKWFYAPLEAGCALVRDPNALRAAFSHQPSYYHFPDVAEDPAINFHELGPQNSRGFRALKVWLAFKQVGREGYTKLIADDIALSRRMYEKVEAHPELEALTHGLSITTFRYVPRDLSPSLSPDERTKYLNELNTTLLTRLQEGGAIYLSNAVINGVFALRACIVNFRTSVADVDAVPDIVVKAGRMLSQSSR